MTIVRPLSLIDRLLAEYERTGVLPAIRGGDHGDPPATPPAPPATPPVPPVTPPATPPAEPPKVEFSPEQQKKLNDLLAAERKATEDRLAAEAAKRAQDEKEQRERDDAEKRGEFETVKTSLVQERDTLKSRLGVFEELVRKDVEASWSSIPEEVRETYDGADDDVLAKKQHMDRNAKIIQRLTADAAKLVPGNPPNPPVGGPDPVKIESPLTRRQILS